MVDQLDFMCNYNFLNRCGGETLFDQEVLFDDGMRVAIQVIESQSDIQEDFAEPAWTQGVLFTPEGQEISCTEVQESLTGVYHCPDGDDVYIVTVTGDMS
jgi:hypothetical protein